jgi:hypothetical protein
MSRQVDIRQLVIEHQRRLRQLELKKAKLGINTPAEILNEIEDIQAEIERLETELRVLPVGDAIPRQRALIDFASSRGVRKWWESQSDPLKVAYIALLGTLFVAVCQIFSGVPEKVLDVFLNNRDIQVAMLTPPSTPTPPLSTAPAAIATSQPITLSQPVVLTPSLTPPPMDTPPPTPRPSLTLTPTPTATPTYTPTPTPCSTIAIEESGVYCTESGSGGTEILAVKPSRPVARVRVDMAQRATEYGDSLWEVEVYGPGSGHTNVAIRGEACASSAQNDVNCQECFADKVLDGDVNTRWGSDWYDPQWLDISLPHPQIVNCIVLKWEEAYADQYCVSVIEPGGSEPRPAACPFEAGTDAETIVRLIQAESEAVSCENISIIQAIFAEGAIIRDVYRGEEWQDPISRYQTLFANLDFRDLTHFDILPAGPGIAETVAYYTSGNTGQYRAGGGEWQDLYNGSTLDHLDPPTPYGSDHWTLQRNSAGCWVITEFTFNAGHIPFPPE